MAIGVVSSTDFDKEIGKSNKGGHVTKVDIVEVPNKGRKEGDNNVPDSLRKIIGEEALINGRQSALQIAKEFGVSSSSVSAYANGATSTKTYDTPSKSIISHINKARDRAIKKASKVLGQSLDSISQDKLDMTDAKDLAGIARDMSVLIKNLEPDKVIDTDKVSNVQFTIYAPQFRQENSYEVIKSDE